MKKTLLLLFTFAACLLISCDREARSTFSDLDLPEESRIDNLYGYNIKDTTGLDLYNLSEVTISAGEILLVSKKRDNFWIGLYDRNTKEEVQTWMCEMPATLFRQVEQMVPYEIGVTKKGYVLLIGITNLYTDKVNGCMQGLLFADKDKKLLTVHDFSYTGKTMEIFSDKIMLCNYMYDDLYGYERLVNSDFLSPEGKLLVTGVTSKRTADSNIMYAGFDQEDKLWFGLYDTSRKLIEEWYGTEQVERNRQVLTENGGVTDFYITKLLNSRAVSSLLKTPWGYVSQPAHSIPESDKAIFIDMYFLKDGKCIRIPAEHGCHLYNWYEESVLTQAYYQKENRYIVYSSEGEVILKKYADRDDPLMSYGTIPVPVSYESYLLLFNGPVYRRYNLDSSYNIPVWKTTVEEIPSDAQIEWNSLTKSSDNWTYHITYTLADGRKNDLTYTLDVNTGEVAYSTISGIAIL